jgi:RNA polymerase sigma factor (sigma-70 family)
MHANSLDAARHRAARTGLPGADPVGAERAKAPPTDQDLLRGCRSGDGAAWATLVQRYERLVFSVALRNGLSREDAADVTQTTFIALLDYITRLRDDQRLPYWLMTVARRQSWRLREQHERESPYAEVQPGVVDPIEEWERAAVVHEALEHMAAPCRDLLAALYFDPARPSYADVAIRLGRAIGGLGPMRARCLQRLRVLLGEDAIA